MNGDDDQELVSNELLQMQNESYWLIQKEVPIVCKRVRTIVDKCLQLLHPIDIKPEDEEKEENSNSNNNNNNNNSNNIQVEEDNEVNEIFDILKFNDEDLKKVTTQRFETIEGSRGIVNLNGWLVDSTDLFIKTKCRSNNPVVYKDTISKNAPWRLSQIQNAYNHLQFVEAELTSIINFSERYQPNYVSNQNNNNSNVLSSSSSFISNSSINNNNSIGGNNESISTSWLSAGINGTPNRLSVNSNNSNLNNNNNNNNTSGVVPELLSLFETVKSIGEWISMAKDELLLPSREVFPHTLFQKNVLKNLPPDIHIDITVANCDIVFSVHELQISSTDSGQNLGSVHHSSHHHHHHSNSNSNSSNSPSKFLRKSTSGHKAVGGGNPHPQHMQQQLMSNGHINGNSGSLSNSIGSGNSGQQSSPLSSSGSAIPRNNSGTSLNTSTNNLSNSNGNQDLNSSSNNISNTSSPNLLDSSEEYHHPPDQLSKKTYQMNRLGNTQYVTIIDHSESRIPIKKLSDSFALMTSAYDKLADLSEKFMVLSNTS